MSKTIVTGVLIGMLVAGIAGCTSTARRRSCAGNAPATRAARSRCAS